MRRGLARITFLLLLALAAAKLTNHLLIENFYFINIKFLPFILSALVAASLLAPVHFMRMPIKRGIGYGLFVCGVLFMLHALIYSGDTLFPDEYKYKMESQKDIAIDSGWFFSWYGESDEIDIWNAAESDTDEETQETEDNSFGLKIRNAALAYHNADRVFEEWLADYIAGKSPAALVFALLFGGVVLCAGGSIMVAGRFARGEIKTLEDLEARFPVFKGVSEFYDQRMIPWLAQEERRRVLALIIRYTAYLCGILAATHYFLMHDLWSSLLIASVTIVFAEWNLFWLKKEVRAGMAQRLSGYLRLDYQPGMAVFNFKAFEQAGILPDYDLSTAKDILSGSYRGVSFSCCKARLKSEYSHYDANAVGHNHVGGTVLKFEGVVIWLSFPATFVSTIKIFKDYGFIANALRRVLTPHEKHFPLPGKYMERAFEGYASDPAKAQKAVTADVLEKMARLSEIICGEIVLQAAFGWNMALFTIDTKRNLFDIRIGSKLTDPAFFLRFAENFTALFSVIDGIIPAASRYGQNTAGGSLRLGNELL